MIRIKVCGVTEAKNALECARAGADLIGLNFYPGSARYVTLERARDIVDTLRGEPDTASRPLVGVFVNERPERILEMISDLGLDAAQLNGDEPPEWVVLLRGHAYRALRPRGPGELEDFIAEGPYLLERSDLPGALLDAHHGSLYGGTGTTVDLTMARSAVEGIPRLMLAGGLRPGNVADRVRSVRPWGVDVASGVEGDRPGVKNMALVRAFVRAVRRGNGSDDVG